MMNSKFLFKNKDKNSYKNFCKNKIIMINNKKKE